MSAPACPRCAQPMAALLLPGHYGREVELDLCEPCRLVWFDAVESVNLSPLGWIALLERFEHEAESRSAWAGSGLGCPRCRMPLRAVRNLTRWGRFVALECRAHGTLQSHALLLAERGFVRAPTSGERHAVASERRRWDCLNCGAPVDARAGECAYCTTPVLMFDLPRLAGALGPAATERPTVTGGRLGAWACRGCGQAMDPTEQTVCPQCDHDVVAPAVADLRPLLAALRDEWAAWQTERDARRRGAGAGTRR